MESLLYARLPSRLHLPLVSPPASTFSHKLLSLRPFRRPNCLPFSPLHAAHNPSVGPAAKPPASNPVPALAAATVAAAALFVARLGFPAPALAVAVACPPVSTSPPAAASSVEESEESSALPDAEKERILEERLASNPDDVRSLRALMEAKIKSGKVSEAVEIVDRLIALDPEEKDLPLLKAHLQSYSGDTDTAKQLFEELLQKDPFLVEAYHGLVMTVTQSEDEAAGELDGILKRVEDAMELCRKSKRKQDLRDFKLLMAQVRVIEGKYDDSLKIYEELVKEEPRDFRPYLCQGIIYTLMRNKDEAEKQFQKYRRLVPKGHPYAQYFNENMAAMKVFGQMDENRRNAALKN